MTESSAPNAAAVAERYAITDEGRGQRIGTLELLGSGPQRELRLRANSQENLDRIHAALRSAKVNAGNVDSHSAPTAGPHILSVESKLKAEGFGLTKIPWGDLQVQIQIDLSTGRRVATSAPLHEFAAAQGLERRIFDNFGSSSREAFAKTIEKAIELGDNAAAAQAFLDWCPLAGCFGWEHSELLLAQKINVDELDAWTRHDVLLSRIHTASLLGKLTSDTDADLTAFLREFDESISPQLRYRLVGIRGNLEFAQGRVLTALRHWKSALAGDDETRGESHRRISMLHAQGTPDATTHAELAADAFLQAGNAPRAALCLKRLAACLMLRDPKRALAIVDKATALFETKELLDRDRRASLLHYKAVALEKLGRFDEALQIASEAADARRDLLGAEEGRLSSLSLGSLLAQRVGNEELSEQLSGTADAIVEQTKNAQLRFRHSAAAMASNYDSSAAESLRQEAKAAGDDVGLALLMILRGIHEGSAEERLSWLEDALSLLRKSKAPNGDVEVALSALARELAEQGEVELALRYYREALELDPFSDAARQNIARLLMKSARWEEAIQFFENWRTLFGDRPGVLYCLGKAYLETGKNNDAATALMLSRGAEGGTDGLRRKADELAQEAIARGGRVNTDLPKPPSVSPLTHAEFDEVLREFAHFFQAQQRMRLWRSHVDRGHRWVASPERVAQDSLKLFLNGRFGKRIETFEELVAGAGRVDLYVVGAGGFRAILELKMVGRTYTSTYAFDGQEQIAHYLDQKRVSAGYLVLFDARTRDFGKGLLPIVSVRQHTIAVQYVDVRPDSPSKHRRKKRDA